MDVLIWKEVQQEFKLCLGTLGVTAMQTVTATFAP